MSIRIRSLLALVLLVLTALTLRAQDFPYELDWRREATLLGAGAVTSITAHLVEGRIEGLSDEQALLLRPRQVNAFDRGATRQFNDNFRTLSDDVLRSSLALPLLTLAARQTRRKPLVVGLLLAETMLLNDGITKGSKVIVRRNRPLTYNGDFDLGARTTTNARQSFISGHTSNTAALSFFTAKVFHDLYPASKWRPLVWGAAALVPALTGYSRYRAGKHFPTDILAGYAVGAGLGILIPQWHKRPGRRLRVSPGPGGLRLGLRLD